MPSRDPLQHPQRAGHRHLRERPAVQRAPVHQVRRLAAVGGVGEDVVDHQQAAPRELRRPALVVVGRVLLGVPAVDEDQAERRRHTFATCGDRPTTAITCSSSPAACSVLRNSGSVSIRPMAGSTSGRRGTPSRAAAPRCRGGGRRSPRPAAGRAASASSTWTGRSTCRPPASGSPSTAASLAAAYSASPSSSGMNPLAASAACRCASLSSMLMSQVCRLATPDPRAADNKVVMTDEVP